jgi:superfamily II DNA helicase RecQ
LSAAHSVLKEVFGYEAFRGPQEAIALALEQVRRRLPRWPA